MISRHKYQFRPIIHWIQSWMIYSCRKKKNHSILLQLVNGLNGSTKNILFNTIWKDIFSGTRFCPRLCSHQIYLRKILHKT